MPTPHRAGLRNLAPSRPILPHLAPSRARCTGCFGRSTRWRGRRGKPPTVRAERPRRPTGRWPTRWSAPTRSSTSFPWSASSRRIRRPPPRSAETSRGLPWTALGTAGRYLALARLTETHHFRPFFFSFCPPPPPRGVCLEGGVVGGCGGRLGVVVLLSFSLSVCSHSLPSVCVCVSVCVCPFRRAIIFSPSSHAQST